MSDSTCALPRDGSDVARDIRLQAFRERLRAAIERESRAWSGIEHAAWMSEMRGADD